MCHGTVYRLYRICCAVVELARGYAVCSGCDGSECPPLAVLLLITVVMGRVYCSVICPLGIMQDCINWMRSHRQVVAQLA